MKRRLTLFFTIILLISIIYFPQIVSAADGTITVSVSALEVAAGNSVTVYVGVSPALEMGSFDCTLTYDAGVFDYTGGSIIVGQGISSNSGTVEMAIAPGNSFTAGNIASLTFKAKASGSTNFTVTRGSSASLMKDFNLAVGSFASVRVVNSPAATIAPTTASTVPKQSPLTTVATIEPTTTDTTQTEETKSEPTKAFKAEDHKGRSLSISEIALEEADIPSGFEEAERMIDGSAMSGYYSENEDLFLALLSLSGQDPQLYFYNDSSDSFIPYLRFKLGEEYYHVTLMPDDLIPYGTSRSDADIRDVNLPVIEFNFGDYIPFDEYMKQYQAQLSKSSGASTASESTENPVSDNITTMDIEIDRVNEARYLLALEGRNKDIERFIYSRSLDQLMHYDLLLVPAFGTFLDEDFDHLAKEDPKGPELQTEPVSAPTEAVEGDLDEGTDKVQSRTVSLFGRDFELWHIIAAAGGVLLILIILIIIIIKFNSDRKRAEFPFADEFLSDDFMYSSGEDALDVKDDSDAENFRPVDYNYPDNFPEVRDISDISSKVGQGFSKEYQTTSSERSDPEDQEEI